MSDSDEHVGMRYVYEEILSSHPDKIEGGCRIGSHLDNGRHIRRLRQYSDNAPKSCRSCQVFLDIHPHLQAGTGAEGQFYGFLVHLVPVTGPFDFQIETYKYLRS